MSPLVLAAATTVRLDNGLVALLLEDHRTDTVAIELTVGVGSLDELPGELGCAHLFEHLMFEASRNVPTGKFDEWLEAAGGENNAFTSEDETRYVASFPSGALDRMLFLESDRLGFLDAGLVPENLENQRQIVLRERAEGYAEPWGMDADALSHLTWPAGHPYHHPTIGTEADVRGFDIDGVRSFWERHYRPANVVLSLVGNFDTAEAVAKLQEWFSDVPDRGPPVARPVAPQPGGGVPQAGLLESGIDEQTLYLSWETVPAWHADEPALDLLARVLASGRGTRLDRALYVERSIATDLGAYVYDGRLAGVLTVYASTASVGLVSIRERVEREVERLAHHPPSAAEVDRARASWRSEQLDTLETPEGRASLLVRCYTGFGRADCLGEWWGRYDAVQPEDLTRVAAAYLDRPPTTLSNVPRGKTELAIPGASAVVLP